MFYCDLWSYWLSINLFLWKAAIREVGEGVTSFVRLWVETRPYASCGCRLAALGGTGECARPYTSNFSHKRFFSSAQLFEEATDGFDPAVEVRDVKLLVGSVKIVVGEAEAHHDTGNLQHVLEVSDDGNGAATADEDRIFLEGVVQGRGRGL